MNFFAVCPKGMELLLADELRSFGATECKEGRGGTYFQGELEQAYRACLWSRLANRILLPLFTVPIQSVEEIYPAAFDYAWEEHLDATNTMAVGVSGQHPNINNNHYAMLRVKDAIADRFLQRTQARPSVDVERPDLRVHLFLDREHCTVSLDLSGHSLHQRGYRADGGEAPLKENLAAAILMRAGWPQAAARGEPLLDPMCGSGTLLIEAAMMATDTAPGLHQVHYGFTHWRQHDAVLWQRLRDEADTRKQAGMAACSNVIVGMDSDARTVSIAQRNIASAGYSHIASVIQADVNDEVPRELHDASGLIVVNPPYGERLGEEALLQNLYRALGRFAKGYPGWTLALFTGNPELTRYVGLRKDKLYHLYNGAIPCELRLFTLLQHLPRPEGESVKAERTVSPNVTMLVNRLQKNRKRLKAWIKQADTNCYRVYDRDLPEYAVAVDVYADWLHVQEYMPPADIELTVANQRVLDMLDALHIVFPESADKTALKRRARQKGSNQYQALGDFNANNLLWVNEGPCQFGVNLTAYLDTGLFLDHRPVRRMIRTMAKGKSFLNLFAYTSTATVHAALGGARSSLSVDMSYTYGEWSRQNFVHNRIDTKRHRIERADCFDWLTTSDELFDLVLLDPPTFSNSKSMERTLDIQRDHVDLIQQTMRHVTPGGTLIFSNNFRKFKLDAAALSEYEIDDFTPRSVDQDFSRGTPHHCYFIRQAS